MHKNPPFVTRTGNSEGVWFDRLAAFLPLIAMSLLVGGGRSMVLILTAAVAAAAVEGAFCLILNRKRFSVMPIVMGLTLIMVCPLSLPVGMAAAGSAVAAALGELLLHFKRGGLFSVPAVAWLILLLCAPGVMTAFPAVDTLRDLPLFKTPVQFDVQEGILSQLHQGVLPNLSTQDLLFGNVAGGLGATGLVAVAVSFLYLLIRRATAWETTLSFAVALGVLSVFVMPSAASMGQFALLQLSSGSLWYAAVFLASDTGAPKTRLMRVAYGVLCAFSVIEMRAVGFGEFSVPFAIVSCGILCTLCERFGYRLLWAVRGRKK